MDVEISGRTREHLSLETVVLGQMEVEACKDAVFSKHQSRIREPKVGMRMTHVHTTN